MSEKTKSKKSTAATIRTKGRRVEKDLPVVLTDKELLNVGDEAAKLHEKVTNLRIAKKARVEELTGEIKATEAAITALTLQIRTRTVTRPVMCEEEFVHRDGMVVTRRLDTRKVVESRPMTPGERQPGLFPIDGGKVEPKTDAKGKGKKVAPEAAAAAP